MRYRSSDALRSKSSLFLSANRLFLIYKTYVNWMTYTNTLNFSIESGQCFVKPCDSTLINSSFYFRNYSTLRGYYSYFFRSMLLLVYGNGIFTSSVSDNNDIFGQYAISGNNICVNL